MERKNRKKEKNKSKKENALGWEVKLLFETTYDHFRPLFEIKSILIFYLRKRSHFYAFF